MRFSGAQEEKWSVEQIDFASTESVLVFDRARLVVSFDAMRTGRRSDAKLAGAAFLIDDKIAISGLIHPKEAMVFHAEDGSCVKQDHKDQPYFSSWDIEVPDGDTMWRKIL
jgi:hypothetical protein